MQLGKNNLYSLQFRKKYSENKVGICPLSKSEKNIWDSDLNVFHFQFDKEGNFR